MERQFKTAIEAFQEQEKYANQERMLLELKKMAESASKQAEAAQAQAEASKDQAETAKEQAALAKQEAESAREEAHNAKQQSKINTWIAVAAVVVAILAWLVPDYAVRAAICAFFQTLQPIS